MTITRYRGLIKVDDWHEQHFKGAINQRAQAHSSLQLSDGGPHRRSLLKDLRTHLTGGGRRKNKGGNLTPCHLTRLAQQPKKTPTSAHVRGAGLAYTYCAYTLTAELKSQHNLTITRQLKQIQEVVDQGRSRGAGWSSHHVPWRTKVWLTEVSHYCHQGVKTALSQDFSTLKLCPRASESSWSISVCHHNNSTETLSHYSMACPSERCPHQLPWHRFKSNFSLVHSFRGIKDKYVPQHRTGAWLVNPIKIFFLYCKMDTTTEIYAQ